MGTPQWMAPEALSGGMYDSRIDIWSFGITIIEMAKQNPPHSNVPPHRVVDMIPRLPPPRLEGGTWSNALREFVALCLNEVPEDRATVDDLQKTMLVRAAKAPTSIMRELLNRYELWEKSGGARASLLYPGMNDYDQEDSVDPCWDFDTIKSRASGVPKEWEMTTKPTIKAPPRAPLRGVMRSGAAGDHLYKLFEDPQEDLELQQAEKLKNWTPEPAGVMLNESFHVGSNTNHLRSVTPEPSINGGMNFIEIPSFDDDGMQLPEQFIPMNSSPLPLSQPPPLQPSTFQHTPAQSTASSFQSAPFHPPPIGFNSGFGQIHMPSEAEMLAMAQQKAASLTPRGPPTPTPPPSAPLPIELPGSGLTVTAPPRPRADSTSSILTSPYTTAQSAPTSPPHSRVVPANALLLGSPGATMKSFHIPSKSVPNMHRRTPSETPPVPGAAPGTPKFHSKTVSSDNTVRPFRAGQRTSRPGMLNLSNQTREFGAQAVHGDNVALEWPVMAPLDAGVLGTGQRAVLGEFDRMLSGIGDALEVMEAALKRLGKEKDKEEGEEKEVVVFAGQGGGGLDA